MFALRLTVSRSGSNQKWWASNIIQLHVHNKYLNMPYIIFPDFTEYFLSREMLPVVLVLPVLLS